MQLQALSSAQQGAAGSDALAAADSRKHRAGQLARKRARSEAQAAGPGSPRRSGRVAALECVSPTPNGSAVVGPVNPASASDSARDTEQKAGVKRRAGLAGRGPRTAGSRPNGKAARLSAWGSVGPGCPLPSPARRLRGDRLNRDDWDADEEAFAWDPPTRRPRTSAMLAICERTLRPAMCISRLFSPPQLTGEGADGINVDILEGLKCGIAMQSSRQRARHEWEFSVLERANVAAEGGPDNEPLALSLPRGVLGGCRQLASLGWYSARGPAFGASAFHVLVHFFIHVHQ